jgi:protein-S-isoprenylcysteine O-methyltransferase Ste14
MDWFIAAILANAALAFAVRLFIPLAHRNAYKQSRITGSVKATAFCSLALWALPVAQWLSGFATTLPTPYRLTGLALIIFGGALTIAARRVNPYFTMHVTCPHEIISTGIYRFFRHPGYYGMTLFTLGITLTLAQSWGILPLFVYYAILTRRIIIENRLLYGGR